ncbi:type II toxin-antitoxin system VapC family toxin [Candidatus Woesearchaeota archaeon]|nr:type II toxin-antitoxin system VapC family toxin [Candidatus Woesearchaeota archaeon]
MAETSAILIDTNVIVDHLRSFAPAMVFVESCLGRDSVFFSAITEVELLAGDSNKDRKKREMLLHLLGTWTKVAPDNPIAASAGDIRREHGLDVPDAIVAATALYLDAEIMTRNIKDFKHVPGLRARAPY